MILNRLKNLWAWSAYHPSSPPEEVGSGLKKALNHKEKAQIIKKKKDILEEIVNS